MMFFVENPISWHIKYNVDLAWKDHKGAIHSDHFNLIHIEDLLKVNLKLLGRRIEIYIYINYEFLALAKSRGGISSGFEFVTAFVIWISLVDAWALESDKLVTSFMNNHVAFLIK